MLRRREISHALDALIARQDGIAFQRLSRRLLRSQFGHVFVHNEHADFGVDATINFLGNPTPITCSLTASVAKIRQDLQRLVSVGAPARLVFCTPRVVTRARSHRWSVEISNDFGVELHVFERSWVEDECLREENSLIVRDELGVSIDSLTNKELVVGAAEPLTGHVERVFGLAANACHDVGSVVTWSTPPDGGNDEEVHILLLGQGRNASRTIIGGADPFCLVERDKIWVSWIRRELGDESWTFTVQPLDVDLADAGDPIVLSGITSVEDGPRLYRLNGELVALYSHHDAGGLRVVVRHLASGQSEAILCPDYAKHTELVSATDGGTLSIAYKTNERIAETGYRVVLLTYRGGLWLRAECTELPPIRRLALSSSGSELLMLCELHHRSLELLTYDVVTGRVVDRTLVSSYGTYPALVSDAGKVVAAWCGAVAEPREYQIRRRRDRWTLVETSLRLSREWEKLERAVYAEAGRPYLWRTIVPPFSAGLFMGHLDADGTIVPASYPLGVGLRFNHHLALSADGGSGILAWFGGGEVGEGTLFARRFETRKG